MTKPQRYHLRTLANQTKQMLLLLLFSLACLLFVMQLFLMNRLSMSGYILTREVEQNSQLLTDQEKLDSQIARIQTQEYVTKTSESKFMVVKSNQRFVQIKPNITVKR